MTTKTTEERKRNRDEMNVQLRLIQTKVKLTKESLKSYF